MNEVITVAHERELCTFVAPSRWSHWIANISQAYLLVIFIITSFKPCPTTTAGPRLKMIRTNSYILLNEKSSGSKIFVTIYNYYNIVVEFYTEHDQNTETVDLRQCFRHSLRRRLFDEVRSPFATLLQELLGSPLGFSKVIVYFFFSRDLFSGRDYKIKTSAADKVVIITGANTGLGKEAARLLAIKNATVVMACRDMVKCEKVNANISVVSIE